MLNKKLRFLKEINTLYPYILHRLIVRIKTIFNFKPTYPYEDEYRYDRATESRLAKIKKEVPDALRGDNPSFSKKWGSVVDREQKAREIGQKIQAAVSGMEAGPDPDGLVRLERDGYVELEDKSLDGHQVDEIRAFLDQQRVYPSHVAHFSLFKPGSLAWVKKRSPFGSYDLETILKAPHINRMIADEGVISLISRYFGCLPTVSSINLFWSFVTPEGLSRGPQRFHRDVDDYKTVTMFINLTDTYPDDGAHCYVRGTHAVGPLEQIFDGQRNDTLEESLNPFAHRMGPKDFFNLPLNGYGFDKLYQHFFEEQYVRLYGRRGKVIITDNYGIHRGIPPKKHDRLILWVSFALTATHTQSASVKPQKRADYRQIQDRVPDNEINRYVLRNVVDFSKMRSVEEKREESLAAEQG